MGNSGGMALTSSGYAYESFGDPLSSAAARAARGRPGADLDDQGAGRHLVRRRPARPSSADLRDLGADRLEGTITNRLGRPLAARSSPTAARSTTSTGRSPRARRSGSTPLPQPQPLRLPRGRSRRALNQVYTYDVDARGRRLPVRPGPRPELRPGRPPPEPGEAEPRARGPRPLRPSSSSAGRSCWPTSTARPPRCCSTARSRPRPKQLPSRPCSASCCRPRPPRRR